LKIAVLGAEGQLGSDVCAKFEENSDTVFPLSHKDVEIASFQSVRKALYEIEPHIVVNTAAFHNVEKCENDAKRAFAVNGCGARNVAAGAAEVGAVVFHISTDYVFDGSGRRPYVEKDCPHPLNLYGVSKLAGEHLVRNANPKHFVLRTSAIYGANPCRAKGGLNFVELMRKLGREREEVKVVDSEFISPTPTADIATQMVKLSRCEAFGLYHASAEGECSWFEFAQEIFSLTRSTARLRVASPSDFPAKVARPAYSVLENQALKAIGVNIFSPWRIGLREYLAASARDFACNKANQV
jgi:dTDP-4-dehydrorhamnose reductase